MSCSKVFNFVTRATIILPPPSARTAPKDGAERPKRPNLLHADAETLALIERHQQMLMQIHAA